jgi:hypothetical protein
MINKCFINKTNVYFDYDDCVIAFDDFLNRPYYHIVLDYYDIIEKTKDNSMVILYLSTFKIPINIKYFITLYKI